MSRGSKVLTLLLQFVVVVVVVSEPSSPLNLTGKIHQMSKF